jgi:hypothetical protein
VLSCGYRERERVKVSVVPSAEVAAAAVIPAAVPQSIRIEFDCEVLKPLPYAVMEMLLEPVAYEEGEMEVMTGAPSLVTVKVAEQVTVPP